MTDSDFVFVFLKVQHWTGVPPQEAGSRSPKGAYGVCLWHHHTRHQQPAPWRRDHLHHLWNSPGIPRAPGHTHGLHVFLHDRVNWQFVLRFLTLSSLLMHHCSLLSYGRLMATCPVFVFSRFTSHSHSKHTKVCVSLTDLRWVYYLHSKSEMHGSPHFLPCLLVQSISCPHIPVLPQSLVAALLVHVSWTQSTQSLASGSSLTDPVSDPLHHPALCVKAFKNMWVRRNERAAGHNSHYSPRHSLYSSALAFDCNCS